MSKVFKANISEAIRNEPESEEDTETNKVISGRIVKRLRLFTIATNICGVLSDCDSSRSTGVSSDESNVHCDLYSFKPIYSIDKWEDEREDRGVTVAILMPSGSCDTPRDKDLRVSDNGNNLKVTAVWLQCMTDFLYLHKFEVGVDQKAYENLPRELSIRAYSRKLRSKADYKITSKCSILLPIQVKLEIALIRKRHRLLRWHNTGQNVFYVTLEAPGHDIAEEDERILEITIA